MIKHETNAEYHSSEPLSKSRLFKMSVSPEWFKYCESNPQEQTEALLFGSAFHKIVLEPQDFEKEFVVSPKVDRRTKAWKDEYGEFESEAKGKSIISADMFAQIVEMRNKIMSNDLCQVLLSKGEAEASYYTEDDVSGIPFKVRPDYRRDLGKGGVITDLKTCNDASREAFVRDAIKYGYDLQAFMYKLAVDKEYEKSHDFVFIAIEKKPPYLINVMQADEFLLKRGKDLFREYIGLYQECSASGNWYGYNGFTNSVNNLTLPAWMVKDYE